jgi:hexokinase
MQILQNFFENYIAELKSADRGEKTSLAYIKNSFPKTSLLQENEKFQVITIGGSILKSALIEKKSSGEKIISIEKMRLPFFHEKKILLNFIEENIKSDIKTLAVNFAYAIKPIFENGRPDGILLYGDKEHSFDGLVGHKIGKTIEEYFQHEHKREIKVSVANDSVCLLLSGLGGHNSQELAAGIVGTGINFALFSDKNTIINLESGNFSKFSPSPTTLEIDAASQEKGKYLFEKEVAGGYLYKHFNSLIKQRNINYPPISSTEHLSLLAQGNLGEVSDLAKELLVHSAQLAACAIAGITKFKGHNMTFVMQGSLFWDGYSYKEMVAKTVRELVPEYEIKFVRIENAGILGAIKLLG